MKIQPSEPGEIVLLCFFESEEEKKRREELEKLKKPMKKRFFGGPKRFLVRKRPDGRLKNQVTGEIFDFDPEKMYFE